MPYLRGVQTKSFAQIYSTKTNDELIALAADTNALVEEARPVLAEELVRRNLATAESSPAETSALPRSTQLVRLLRVAGLFALNLAIATLGTSVVESPIWSVWSRINRAHTILGIEAREWLLSIVIAALFGFFTGRRWRTTAIWVWTLPVAFFGLGALLHGDRSPHSVLVGGGFAKHFFAPNCSADPHDCWDFFLFTVPAVRTISYSLAAGLSKYFSHAMDS